MVAFPLSINENSLKLALNIFCDLLAKRCYTGFCYVLTLSKTPYVHLNWKLVSRFWNPEWQWALKWTFWMWQTYVVHAEKSKSMEWYVWTWRDTMSRSLFRIKVILPPIIYYFLGEPTLQICSVEFDNLYVPSWIEHSIDTCCAETTRK